ncbi:MAG TPA: hypothetical protein DCE42_05130 [Myxococcales bacterium]|nr:hypothetical protein [Deltaproteobacteria bacterium]MBU47856.1 hypothetical protein [Deltaproteobacteria bacterium]HAA54114.1 hypothetical protein [Myxococcales bacterium]|tara:strand:+ start:5131 stop:6381 length:1251 start_codon:yes stop_codon:yes gene_type:complete
MKVVKGISLDVLQKGWEQFDGLTGNKDGYLSETEVKDVLQKWEGASAPSETKNKNIAYLNKVLDAIRVHGKDIQEQGPADFQHTTGWNNNPQSTTTAKPNRPTNSVMGTMMSHMQSTDTDEDVLTLKKTGSPNSVTDTFKIYGADRKIPNEGVVEMPLRAGEPLHVIEVKYKDPRNPEEMEFYYKEKGSWDYQPIMGKDLHTVRNNPDIEFRKEPDAGKPWINATRVKFEIVDKDGHSLWSTKKTVDPDVELNNLHKHRYAEKDNVNKTWDSLPNWPMPEGAKLRVTVLADERAEETHGDHALELDFVQPVYVPEHSETKTVFSSSSWQKPPAEGFQVDPNREISAVVVTWTDHAGPCSGGLSFNSPDGQVNTKRVNVGSGEDKFFILEGKASVDGRIKINAPDRVEVKKIEVMYK